MSQPTISPLPSFLSAGVLEPIDLAFARAMGRLGGTDVPSVLLAAALASRAPRHGHVCLSLSSVRSSVRLELPPGARGVPLRWPEPLAWRTELAHSALVGEGSSSSASPLVLDEDELYLRRYWRYQDRLLRHLEARCRSNFAVGEPALRDRLTRLFPSPSSDPDLQQLATLLSVLSGLTVISGGPGTGKTQTVAAILALLLDLAAAGALEARQDRPLRAALLAPTGKAAARLRQAMRHAKSGATLSGVDRRVLDLIPEETATLHRALGLQASGARRGQRGATFPLPWDVVVVDEASMIPLGLMARLLEAVPPGARLILLGDRNQLASVEAGAVLGDICADGADSQRFSTSLAARVSQLMPALPERLIHPGEVPVIADHTVHLERNYRFAESSGIRSLARAINAGDARQTLDCLRSGLGDVELLHVENAGELAAAVRARTVRAYRRAIETRDPREALMQLDRFRLLCAHRQGELGVEGLNRSVQSWLADEGLCPAFGEWYPGRPLLCLENSYPLHLFNGDAGIVLPADGGGLRAYFLAGRDEELRVVHPARLPVHQTAFAMTIHKSQGSEFEEVMVILPRGVSPILTRELLYTAVTRASRRVIIVGTEAVIEHAIGQRISRSSGIHARLWGAPRRGGTGSHEGGRA